MRENLKNVVLFMSSSGFLVPSAQNPSKQSLWDETWRRVDRFLPELRSDLASEGLDQPLPTETPAENTEEGQGPHDPAQAAEAVVGEKKTEAPVLAEN